MLPKENGVKGCQCRLLTGSGVTPLEAESGSCFALVVLSSLWQEVFAPPPVRESDVEASIGSLAKVVRVALVATVNLGRVNESRVLVQLLTRA